MEKLSLDEFFPQTAGLSINSDEPSAELPAREPQQAEPATQSSGDLRQEVDGIKTLLGAVVAQQANRQPVFQPQQYAPDPQQLQRQYEENLSYKPREFMSDDDAAALLTTQKPKEKLNQIFNQVAEQVYQPMAQELRKRDAVLAQMVQNDQQKAVQAQAQQLMSQNVNKFYSSHPDMQEFADLVPIEAQRIAIEAQNQPHLFMGKSDDDVHNLLAARVKNRVKQYAGVLTGESQGETQTITAPRTMMEGGAGARAGAPRREANADRNALKEMSQWHRNGKRM